MERPVKNLHFIGISGAGMAPLAMLARGFGCAITGSDSAPGKNAGRLRAAGITVNAGHSAANLPAAAELVVYSSAVSADNPERREAERRGIPQIRRGEFLARLSGNYCKVAAISGAHGKSSTTALLAHILQTVGANPSFLIGAEMNGVGNFAVGGSDIFVTEVDESDGTHTFMHPYLGIVPNIEEDHAWSVGGAEQLMRNYRTFGDNSAKLVYCAGENPDRIFSGHPHARRLDSIPDEYLGFFGFQAANAYLAVAAAEELGIDRAAAEAAARTFPGIARRMNVRFASDALTVVEDYAHHPSEIAAALKLLRHRYPEHHLRVLIQPHRYARLEYFFDDFRRVLATADSVLVAPVFAAWCESGKVDSNSLAASLPNARSVSGSWSDIAAAAKIPVPGKKLLVAVLGAGDIEQVFPFLS